MHMPVALCYDPSMADYRFGPGHPLKPERFTLAVELARAWGLIAEHPFGVRGADAAGSARSPRATLLAPVPATEADLLLVHDPAFLAAVRAAGAAPGAEARAFGIGPGDTPAFPHMHEVSALIAGGTAAALDAVLDSSARRAFAPAGGLHHAQRDHASGFCVYNDCAVAIGRATARTPGLRVAYVDIDAHHGDGVESAFAERRDVLTISVHESGRYLFPGTGRATDTGLGAGTGYSLNVPLPPYADPPCWRQVTDNVIGPAVRAFSPDVIVAQCGADSHRADPLTHLHNTVAGFSATVRFLLGLADACCDGRIVLTGGGGYDTYSAVPRMWALALAHLLGRDVPDTLPAQWIARASAEAEMAGATPPPTSLLAESIEDLPSEQAAAVAEETAAVIETVRRASPLLKPER